jgi:hypothetical protein
VPACTEATLDVRACLQTILAPPLSPRSSATFADDQIAIFLERRKPRSVDRLPLRTVQLLVIPLGRERGHGRAMRSLSHAIVP